MQCVKRYEVHVSDLLGKAKAMNRTGSVLIVGGGSSGWMTAALLSKTLPNTKITLVEASDIPVIGVGESTNMTMKYFLHAIGYNERRFMRACEAAYKRAIRFEHFNQVNGVFYHPFGKPVTNGATEEFSPSAQSCYADFDSVEPGDLFGRDCAYSYQVDAGLFAEYLKQQCKSEGAVSQVVDLVTDVCVNEKGEIDGINTKASGKLTAELYVDCTGFRSILLGKTLGEPFESYSNYLLNDSAIAVRVPYVDKDKELLTYTRCTALSAGWVWTIPLWSRIGLGYVYSSNFASRPAAEAELTRYLGEKRREGLELNHLSLRVGRHARAWVKNCVGVGISYGFLEPLESTGISLTQVSIWDLAAALNARTSISTEREIYNRRQRELFDSTRDFIIAHYVLTSREDSEYWRFIRHSVQIPESLFVILMEARARSYHTVITNPHRFYQKDSWNCILSGMGFFGEEPPRPRATSARYRNAYFDVLRKQVHDGEMSDASVGRVFSPEAHPLWYPTW